MTTDRRGFIAGGLGTGILVSGCNLAMPDIDPPEFSPAGRFVAGLRQIEGKADGTLGAEFFDTGTGASVGLNRYRRFGHCSSFKLSLAAMVLAMGSAGEIDAERVLRWTQDDLMFVSPFTTRRLNEGATMRELAEFTQKYSDNAAANILLRELGGPAALTAFWRSVGDDVSRLDRYEPELNDVPVTEYRDTTSPFAMARTVARLAYGNVLPAVERATLRQWMVDTPTGARRVRAGLPKGWSAGDKTGTSIWPGIQHIYVDIGFVEPAGRPPITFATYLRANEDYDGMNPRAEAALASVGELLAEFGEDADDWPF
ncbi:MAG: class A beta-lactamase [Erythrobacter sp.]|uniref:class A beta-lactamase n=1 Tax=Erythrobacter sp. TaxID=1042 RepID=UPI003C775614